jgi:hypothetical protein
MPTCSRYRASRAQPNCRFEMLQRQIGPSDRRGQQAQPEMAIDMTEIAGEDLTIDPIGLFRRPAA